MPERQQAHPSVTPLIVERWSPRSFDGSDIPEEDLNIIFEAAGWAPSAFNIQPWTLLYARRGDANWDRFLALLVEFNQSWAKDASALVFVVSNRMQGRGEKRSENYSHSFDAGAAWAMLALQATTMGYHAHGMTGLQFDEAVSDLGIPEDHRLEAAVAIGRKGPKENLPEGMQEREAPSPRKPVSEIAIAGSFQ
ncbi:MAG: nitroreductase family protein [Novosphingobium sp.]|nr:nitroreductase family protein [Novosphingobium sp.]